MHTTYMVLYIPFHKKEKNVIKFLHYPPIWAHSFLFAKIVPFVVVLDLIKTIARKMVRQTRPTTNTKINTIIRGTMRLKLQEISQ